jgi:hypothetical protein
MTYHHIITQRMMAIVSTVEVARETFNIREERRSGQLAEQQATHQQWRQTGWEPVDSSNFSVLSSDQTLVNFNISSRCGCLCLNLLVLILSFSICYFLLGCFGSKSHLVRSAWISGSVPLHPLNFAFLILALRHIWMYVFVQIQHVVYLLVIACALFLPSLGCL